MHEVEEMKWKLIELEELAGIGSQTAEAVHAMRQELSALSGWLLAKHSIVAAGLMSLSNSLQNWSSAETNLDDLRRELLEEIGLLRRDLILPRLGDGRPQATEDATHLAATAAKDQEKLEPELSALTGWLAARHSLFAGAATSEVNELRHEVSTQVGQLRGDLHELAESENADARQDVEQVVESSRDEAKPVVNRAGRKSVAPAIGIATQDIEEVRWKLAQLEE